MDQVLRFRLGGGAQPLRHSLRGPLAGRLTTAALIAAANETGLWKPWKNKLRFPTVPTAPTATIEENYHPIIYTKYLTPPPDVPVWVTTSAARTPKYLTPPLRGRQPQLHGRQLRLYRRQLRLD